MNFSLGSFIAATEAGYEPQAPRNLKKKDLSEIAQYACEGVVNAHLGLFSCFRLNEDFGLWDTLQNYIQTKNVANDEITKAVQDGNEPALEHAFKKAMKLAFITLFERGALKRLQLIDPLPPEALAEYTVMRNTIYPPPKVKTIEEGAREQRADYVAFSNDPKTSMEMIKDRVRKDAGYKQFYEEQYVMRIQEEGASDRRPRL